MIVIHFVFHEDKSKAFGEGLPKVYDQQFLFFDC